MIKVTYEAHSEVFASNSERIRVLVNNEITHKKLNKYKPVINY